MTAILSNTTEALLISPGDLHELVRGQDQCLVERMTPIVREQNVALDLSQVERIDAAGIAALISLYGRAQDAGNHFKVVNAAPRVREILALVGLDRILLSHIMVQNSHIGPCFERPAA